MTTDQAADQLKDAPEYPPACRPQLLGTTDDFHRRLWGFSRLSFYGSGGDPVVEAEESGRGRAQLTVDRAELVRWCREVLAALGESTGQGQLPEWRPVTDGQGKRPWYLSRYSGDDDMRVPQAQRYYYGTASGNLVRYGSQAGAQHAADALNAHEGRPVLTECAECGAVVEQSDAGFWETSEGSADQRRYCPDAPDYLHCSA